MRAGAERNGHDSTRPLDADDSLGELFERLTSDLRAFASTQVELAKVELKEEAVHAGVAAGFLGAASLAALLAVALLSAAAAWGLAVSPVPGSRAPRERDPVATFGASSVGGAGLGASVLGSQSPASSGDLRRAKGSVAGNLPYWVVTTRSSTLGADRTPGTPTVTEAPLRVLNVDSTQSTP